MSRTAILVLCTGNSCRSQIAEAYLDRRLGDLFDVRSAGMHPADDVHPLTRVVLEEDGFDASGLHPKQARDFLGKLPVHTLITVCDAADRECPSIWPGARERLHWPFPDPAAFEGTEEETLAFFREVRDRIRERVEEWAAESETVASVR
jgi:arsenate reductase (thioredoxin)